MTDVSDSSEEEDLSRFREAVDVSFSRSFKGHEQAKENSHIVEPVKSERYLDKAGHYSDVKVPATLQHQIGAKVSAVIKRNIEFIDVTTKKHKTRKVEGGVKLFKDSSNYLCCNDTEDKYTKLHNIHSRKVGKLPRNLCNPTEVTSDTLSSVTVDGDYILSGKETKFYKSRRKAKIFCYKSNNNNKNTYTLIENT